MQALLRPGVCLTILCLRYAEGAHNPLLGGESERLKVHFRVMTNTLTFLLNIPLIAPVLARFAGSLLS